MSVLFWQGLNPTPGMAVMKLVNFVLLACAVILSVTPAVANQCPSGWRLKFKDHAVPQMRQWTYTYAKKATCRSKYALVKEPTPPIRYTCRKGNSAVTPACPGRTGLDVCILYKKAVQ